MVPSCFLRLRFHCPLFFTFVSDFVVPHQHLISAHHASDYISSQYLSDLALYTMIIHLQIFSGKHCSLTMELFFPFVMQGLVHVYCVRDARGEACARSETRHTTRQVVNVRIDSSRT